MPEEKQPKEQPKKQPEERSGEKEQPKPKRTIPVVILILLLIILAGVGLAWKTEYLDQWLPANIKGFFGREESLDSARDEEADGGEEEGEGKDLSLCGGAESKLDPLDETWDVYYNCALGFSIGVPKEVSSFYGACEWKTDSYRPKEVPVSVEVYEDNDNDVVYIATAHYYELEGETVSEEGIAYFSECNKVTNSLSRLDLEYNTSDRGYYQQAWKIYVKSINDDAGLDEFIKDRYGWGCSLGEKTLSGDQEGVYDVGIAVPPAETMEEAAEKGCLINYGTILKYYPAKNLVVSWNTGQASSFYKPDPVGYDNAYDNQMVDSFKFLEAEDLPTGGVSPE